LSAAHTSATQGSSTVASENELLIFDGRQAEDILSVGEGVLTVEYAHVKENGEGQLPPHGPYGSIHVKIYHPDQSPRAPWLPELELHETILCGPHRTVGDLFEWLDDEKLIYTNYALYDWNKHEFDRVILRVYESDPGPGREHDDLLAALVSREETREQMVTLFSDKMEIKLRTKDLGSDP
jgi:hypothetical protein